MDGSDLTIVVPLWKRTANLDRLLDSIDATVPMAEVLLVVNNDDTETFDAVLAQPTRSGLMPLVIVVEWPGGSTGDYARKINAGYRASDRPCIFTGADDIEFLDGWYEMARPLMVEEEESATNDVPMIGVVGTVDDCNGRTATGDLSTHSLVARWYADLGGAWGRPGTIYCEDYPHEYVDDELVGVAKARHAYAHAFASVVRHHHHIAGRAEVDETYEHGRSRTAESRALFRRRRQLWNPAT